MSVNETSVTSEIDAGFPMALVYKCFLTDALNSCHKDNIFLALREIRRAMKDAPAKRACDFDLSLNEVYNILNNARLSPPLNS